MTVGRFHIVILTTFEGSEGREYRDVISGHSTLEGALAGETSIMVRVKEDSAVWRAFDDAEDAWRKDPDRCAYRDFYNAWWFRNGWPAGERPKYGRSRSTAYWTEIEEVEIRD